MATEHLLTCKLYPVTMESEENLLLCASTGTGKSYVALCGSSIRW